MNYQLDLFQTALAKPERAAPRVLMHVSQTDIAHTEEHEGPVNAKFHCRKCGYETGWILFGSTTAAKAGVPCKNCNKTIAYTA